MKWLIALELLLMFLCFAAAGWIYITGRSADDQLAATFPFAVGVIFAFMFLVTLIVKAFID